MTLVSMVLLGLPIGLIFGLRRRTFLITAAIWLIALTVQSIGFAFQVLHPGHPAAILRDPGYWAVQPVILGLGLALTWVGAKIVTKVRGRRAATA